MHAATASRALNPDQSHLVSSATRARVLTAAQDLGYTTNALAQSLRKGTTGVVGVIVANLDNPFITALLRGIDHELSARELLPLVAESHDDPLILRRIVTRLLSNRVDAIIISAVQSTDEPFIAELEKQIPVVLAVRSFDLHPGTESHGTRLEVLHDDVLGAQIAVSHLIRQGHTRIAQIRGNPRISSFAWRSQGYATALSAHRDVVDVSSELYALESTVPEGRRLAMDLLRLPEDQRPTAIFAHNDLMAVGAIDAIRLASLRCPQDISVIGYNDDPLIDHLDPPLSTVRLPGFEMGRHSARMVFNALNGGPPSSHRIMLAPEFIERKSTRVLA